MKTILGTMTFSGQVDIHSAEVMINAYAETKGLELDTAYVYNGGNTEELLGHLNSQNKLNGMQLAGKANPWVEEGLSPASVEHQLNTSLNRLQMDSIDLFYLHAPDLNTPIVLSLIHI